MGSTIGKKTLWAAAVMVCVPFLLGLEGDSIYEGLDLYNYLKKPSLEDLIGKAPFLKEYCDLAKKERKYVMFPWKIDWIDDYKKYEYNINKNTYFKKYFIYKDSRLDLETLNLQTRNDMYHDISQHVQADSFFYAFSDTIIIAPDGRMCHFIVAEDLRELQRDLFIIGINYSLGKNKDARFFLNAAASVKDYTPEGAARGKIVETGRFPEPLHSMLLKAVKNGTYHIMVISKMQTKELSKQGITDTKEKYGKAFPGFDVEVVGCDSAICPIIEQGYLGWSSSTEYAVWVGPQGILWYTHISGTLDSYEIMRKLGSMAYSLVREGESKEALKIYKLLRPIAAEHSFYKKYLDDNDEIIKRLEEKLKDKGVDSF